MSDTGNLSGMQRVGWNDLNLGQYGMQAAAFWSRKQSDLVIPAGTERNQ
jgi:hypothetical protein